MTNLNYQNLVIVYVLKLENEKYYVGFTQDIKTRFMSCMQGTGAQFTIDHAPISIDKLLLVSRKNARLLIDEIVIKLRAKHGKDSVRGGAFANAIDPDSFIYTPAFKNYKNVDQFIEVHNKKFKNRAIKAKELSFREAVTVSERIAASKAATNNINAENSATSTTATNTTSKTSKFVLMASDLEHRAYI